MASCFKDAMAGTAEEFVSSLAVSAEQIALTAHPERRTDERRRFRETVSGDDARPYLVWKDDLDLARRVNDFLSRER